MEQQVENYRLLELKGSGYEIVDNQPDILGWTIRDYQGKKLGVVNDLLFDPDLRKVRYIIASTRGNDYDLEGRKVLIPIGLAQIHEKDDDVLLPSISAWQIRALPAYRKDHLTRVEEQDIFTIFSAVGSTAGTSTGTGTGRTDLYEHQYYNHDNLYRNRRSGQLDQPIERSFRLRQNSDTGNRSNLYDGPDTDQRTTREGNYHIDTIQMEERIMDTLQRMELEIGELKKEIRLLHEDSGHYVSNVR
jgi:hypothetical protein